MKCDICGQEVANSEDLLKHKEEVHPTGAEEKSTESLERPDLVDDTPEASTESEVPAKH